MLYVVFCKIDHCIHIHWCIPMGLGRNNPWAESHMWPQQTWGQRSLGVNDLWFKFVKKGSLYPHTLMYFFIRLGHNDPWVETHIWPEQTWGQRSSKGQWPLVEGFEKGHCIHILWCIFMGLGHNDTWVVSHMWPQQTWGQRSSRGQTTFGSSFGMGSNLILQYCKVCDRKSRRDSWFENCLVFKEIEHKTCLFLVRGAVPP